MTLDWQSLAVALIVAAALLYVARRGRARLRSFLPGAKRGASDCAAGCGKCGEPTPAPTRPRVIQISRARTPTKPE